jgi:Zn-dependent M16 (insulinase) family peptidase
MTALPQPAHRPRRRACAIHPRGMLAGMSFTLARRTPVPALGLDLEEWRHPCGALHLHLACADEHRAFCAAVRTQPGDSTGLPHILEHTVLCGSRRYPVRDPFFQMLRRSLQTFMNAMTYPDLTAYPFATQVSKDYGNLLDVYLDAVFAPRLREEDFAQEGHRLAPADGAWARQGVVYNEMKGAMDSTSELLSQALAAALLPDTCYRHNYGGDPAAIPALTHAGLVAFHRRCYQPANAVFCTYGACDPADLHRRLAPYLASAGSALPPPPVQRPLPAPVTLAVPVPWAEGQEVKDVTAAGITWVWDDGAGLDEALDGELIERLLMGHAASPLRLALEGSGLGRSTGSTGYSGGYRNGMFTAELDGIDPADAGKVHALVRETLAAVARDGVAADEIEAALHQVELSRREIRGDSYPYGLELCLRLVGPWNCAVDPLGFLDQAPAIARLRARAGAPGWLQGQVSRRLLDNPHHAVFSAAPDRAYHQRLAAAEQARDAAEAAAAGEAGRAALAALCQRLEAHQDSKDDPAVLPDLELADVPARRRWAEGRPGAPWRFAAGTNGIVHHLAAFPLPALDDDELDLLPLAAQVVGQLGAGALGYTAQAARLNACCGGLSAWIDIGAAPTGEGLESWLFAEVKGLGARAGEFVPLLPEALRAARFDEHDRLRELVDQALQSAQERVTRGGHQLAARAAVRGLGGAGAIAHRVHGLGRLAWLKRTADAIDGGEACAALAARLQRLLARIAGQAPVTAVIGEEQRLDALATLAGTAWNAAAGAARPGLASPAPCAIGATAFTTATQVSYAALAFRAPPMGHPDSPLLAVAARLASNQVLHPRLREKGGAYGGSASYLGAAGAFACTSYRDPRLAATLEDMRFALRWLAECPDDARMLKEAVLGVIAGLDSPGSPAGECRSRFIADRKGAGPELLDPWRARALAADAAGIRRVAAAWLPADGGTIAAITGDAALERDHLGWARERL